jgi:hypothetical protein
LISWVRRRMTSRRKRKRRWIKQRRLGEKRMIWTSSRCATFRSSSSSFPSTFPSASPGPTSTTNALSIPSSCSSKYPQAFTRCSPGCCCPSTTSTPSAADTPSCNPCARVSSYVAICKSTFHECCAVKRCRNCMRTRLKLS